MIGRPLSCLAGLAALGACSLFAPSLPCEKDADCPTGACDERLCVPSRPASDGGGRIVDGGGAGRAEGGPRPDASEAPHGGDGWDALPPLDDAGPVEGEAGPPDAAILDEAGPLDGGALPDAAPPDAAPSDAPPPVPDAGVPCGNDIVEPGEECDGEPGCSAACVFGRRVCAGDDEGRCYRAIDGLAHGLSALTPPTENDGPDHPYFQDLVWGCDTIVDTGGGAPNICGTGVSAHVSLGSLVLTARSLAVTGRVRFRGARRVVLAIYGDVRIAPGAHLGVDAAGTTPGAGAASCSGGNGIGANESAGAGGSHGTRGGQGGDDNDAQYAQPNPITSTSIHDELRGGCRGGNGEEGALGGGAGGALQISSGARIFVGGAVSANGGGGRRGDGNDGAGGGGSGGDIYLQAVRIVVEPGGAIVAQGGGGGGGGKGSPGQDGPLDPAAFALGGGAGSNGSAGGAGAGGFASGTLRPAADGGRSTSGGVGGGGGGGGAGRIGLLLEADCAELPDRFSPAPSCREPAP